MLASLCRHCDWICFTESGSLAGRRLVGGGGVVVVQHEERVVEEVPDRLGDEVQRRPLVVDADGRGRRQCGHQLHDAGCVRRRPEQRRQAARRVAAAHRAAQVGGVAAPVAQGRPVPKVGRHVEVELERVLDAQRAAGVEGLAVGRLRQSD